LKLSVVTNEIGETIEVLDATLEGTPMTIGFNPDYLAAGIDAVAGEQLMIETTDPVKPAVLRGPDSPGYLYLVMPQRLTQ
jgi:DNA polymerase-3 subunit beta